MAGGVTTCGADGSWSEVECVPANCSVEVSNLLNGKSQVDAMNGETITFSCEEGYKPSHDELNCSGLDFEEVGISCTLLQCLAITPENSGTSLPLEDYDPNVNQERSVSCSNGFQGGGVWDCILSEDGLSASWQGTACTPKVCDEVSINFSSSHTELSATNFDQDIIVENIICNDGYTGGGNWSCNVDGNGDVAWVGSVCEPATCSL